MCLCGGSENILEESVLSFFQVGLRSSIQVIRLDAKSLYPWTLLQTLTRLVSNQSRGFFLIIVNFWAWTTHSNTHKHAIFYCDHLIISQLQRNELSVFFTILYESKEKPCEEKKISISMKFPYSFFMFLTVSNLLLHLGDELEVPVIFRASLLHSEFFRLLVRPILLSHSVLPLKNPINTSFIISVWPH